MDAIAGKLANNSAFYTTLRPAAELAKGSHVRDESHFARGRELLGGSAKERRVSDRVITLLRPAKLIVDDREFLCILRDVSNGGIRLKVFHDIPHHLRLGVELHNGDRHELNLVWRDGEHIGCSFHRQVDLLRLITTQRQPFPLRQLRLRVAIDAVVHAGEESMPVILRDISQSGASLDGPSWLSIDELVRIESDVLPTLYAKVRWRRPPCFGVVFEQTFRLEEFARAALNFAPHASELPPSAVKA